VLDRTLGLPWRGGIESRLWWPAGCLRGSSCARSWCRRANTARPPRSSEVGVGGRPESEQTRLRGGGLLFSRCFFLLTAVGSGCGMQPLSGGLAGEKTHQRCQSRVYRRALAIGGPCPGRHRPFSGKGRRSDWRGVPHDPRVESRLSAAEPDFAKSRRDFRMRAAFSRQARPCQGPVIDSTAFLGRFLGGCLILARQLPASARSFGQIEARSAFDSPAGQWILLDQVRDSGLSRLVNFETIQLNQ
jgi:hypothetical protein